MSDKDQKKHTGKDDSSIMLLAIGAFAVLSFLVIFIVVSFSVSRSEMTTTISPANWESIDVSVPVTDSVQVAGVDTLKDTLVTKINELDTLSLEEIVEEINKVRVRIVETHVAVLKAGDVKKDLVEKYNQLLSIKKELEELKKEREELVTYKEILPKEIVSTVSSRLSERQ